MQSFVEKTIDWISNASIDEKIFYMKMVLSVIQSKEELKAIKSLLSRRVRALKKEAAEESVPAIAAQIPSPMPSVIPSPIPSPSEPQEWVKMGYKPKQIVAVETQFVTKIYIDSDLMSDTTLGKRVIRRDALASVGIVNLRGDLIYRANVKHLPYTYIVNDSTKKVNGFDFKSLEDGEDYEEVRQKVLEIISNKLVIMCESTKHLKLLNLIKQNIDVFDIQDHYFVQYLNDNCVCIRETLGINRLMKNLFNEDIENSVQTSEDNARFVMKVFREAYVGHQNYNRYDNPGYTLEEFHEI